MAVVIETTIGDVTVDLFLEERPKACLNFLKLCRLKYYNFNLFHTIQQGFIAQTGDPTGAGDGGQSIWGYLDGDAKRYFQAETLPKIRHSEPGLLSLVSLSNNMIGSQFFFTLGTDLTSLDSRHCVIGQVTEGFDVLRKLNEAICDATHRPYQDIRITHTVILDDPLENPVGFREPSRSPPRSAERMMNGRIDADEEIDDTAGKTAAEIHEMLQEREAKARATILEIVGDLPDADVAPPENVLFVCKLNPVTSDDDLEIIFSRFGVIKGCEVIRDRVSGDSLQYAFVEFEDQKACENAYFKMDNVLIDDRRIHVDFSQSVAKVRWKGKGRGLVFADGNKTNKLNFSNYQRKGQPTRGKDEESTNRSNKEKFLSTNRYRNQSPSPKRSARLERHYSSHKKYRSRSPHDRQSRSPHRHRRSHSPRRKHSHSPLNRPKHSKRISRSISPIHKDHRRDSLKNDQKFKTINSSKSYECYLPIKTSDNSMEKTPSKYEYKSKKHQPHRESSPSRQSRFQSSKYKTYTPYLSKSHVDKPIVDKKHHRNKKRKDSSSSSSTSSTSSTSTSSSSSSSSDDDGRRKRKKASKRKKKCSEKKSKKSTKNSKIKTNKKSSN